MNSLQTLRAAPANERGGILASLLTTEVAGHLLSDDDIVSILRTWTAGHGTVASAIANLFFHLAKDQALQQQLRAEPHLIPALIEEVLRVDDPLAANRRTTTRDVQINDRKIAAGENLTLMWIAANRDHRTFEDPGSMHVDRDAPATMVFGGGIHFCLGAPLARLHRRVAIEEVLAHTSSIALSDEEAPSRDTYPSNGLVALRVQLS